MAVKQNKNKVHIGIEPVPGDEQGLKEGECILQWYEETTWYKHQL